LFVVAAIAFDLDGTLLDTVHDIAAALNALLAERGLAPLPKPVVRDLIGKGIGNLLERACALSGEAAADAAHMAALLARFQALYAALLGRETVPFPGVPEALARWRDEGFRLAVVTNKATKFVAPHLEHADIARYFDVVIGGDDAPRKKPDAAPMLLAAERLGVAPARLLLIGDSGNDVASARAAGSPVLVVPYGYSEGVPVQSLGADGIVDSFAAAGAWMRLAARDANQTPIPS
jgi:phosphoglycolate phosphatase